MLVLRNKVFDELGLTILPPSLFNNLMDLSYSAFVSKLFIFNDSLILRSCMLNNFASVFRCNQLNHPWQSLECSVAVVQLIDSAHVFLFLQFILVFCFSIVYNCNMRAVVSTIGSPAYSTSKYLVRIIQPTLNKNKQSFKFILIFGRSKGME